MKKLAIKTAIIIEAILGYGIPLSMWVISLGFIWALILSASDSEVWRYLLASILAGPGILGAFFLTKKVVMPGLETISPKALKILIACGLLAVLLSEAEFGGPFMPAVVVTGHFAFIARNYLWQNDSQEIFTVPAVYSTVVLLVSYHLVIAVTVVAKVVFELLFDRLLLSRLILNDSSPQDYSWLEILFSITAIAIGIFCFSGATRFASRIRNLDVGKVVPITVVLGLTTLPVSFYAMLILIFFNPQ